MSSRRTALPLPPRCARGGEGLGQESVGGDRRAGRVRRPGCCAGSLGTDRGLFGGSGDEQRLQLIWALLAENDGKAARELGIDLGRTRLYLPAQPAAKLEAVTSAWGAREGQRVTFGLLDESHNFLKSNGGQRLARVLRRNAAKVDGRTLELANAPELGEGSVAEETEQHFAEGRPGILFEARRPSTEPSPEMDDEQLRALLAEVYAGAPWVDLERLLREVRDPGAPWPEVVRFFFNVPSAGTLAAVDPVAWDACERERELEPGERITLGCRRLALAGRDGAGRLHRGRLAVPGRDH